MSTSTRAIGRALVVLLVLAGVVMAGLLLMTKSSNGDTKPSAAKSTATTSASPSSSPSAKPKDDGTATVGKKEKVPLVKSAPGSPSADTTGDPNTPSSIPAGICPTLESWQSLVTCVENNHLQWYIDGVNQRAKSTGFDWTDVKRWAVAKTAKGNVPEARVIEVYGKGITNKEARSRAADLVGVKAAKSLQIVHQPSCFDNTRGLEAGTMQDFVYCPPDSRQVRVSLVPLKLDKKGHVVALLDTDSGVFVDCQNVWWIPTIHIGHECVTNCGPPPSGGCKHDCGQPTCTHDCNPTPKCPPGQVGTPPNCLTPKSDDPDDYTYPDGKPPVHTSGPADTKPPTVHTHHNGGGGVDDSPTKPPGSETGGTAPGADPPRDNHPTQPPEGGDGSGNNDNDGTVGEP